MNCRAGFGFKATVPGADERRIAKQYAKPPMVYQIKNSRQRLLFFYFCYYMSKGLEPERAEAVSEAVL